MNPRTRTHCAVTSNLGLRSLFALAPILLVTAASVSLTSCIGYTSSSGSPSGAVLKASLSTLNFGKIAVGATGTQTLSLTNTGTDTANISQILISGKEFAISGGGGAISIPAGETTSLQVQYSPTSGTTSSGTLTLTSDVRPSRLGFKLTGIGTTLPVMQMSTTALNFSNVQVGKTSSQSVTITNSGSSNLKISSATLSGTGFGMSGLSFPVTISAGQNAILSVRYTPTSTTGSTGSIVFSDNAGNSPQTLSLAGSAVASGSTASANPTPTGTQAQISATPSSVNFSTVSVGNTNSQPITLTNSGNATLTFSQITVSGTEFSQIGLSPSSTIVAGGSMTFNAQFTPSSSSSVTGSITLATNGTPSTLTIGLSGTGAAQTLSLGASPTSLSFGNVNDGSSSSLSTSVTNNGNANITISSVTTSGAGFSASGVSSGMILTPGQAATLTVTFAPTSGGAVSGANVKIAS